MRIQTGLLLTLVLFVSCLLASVSPAQDAEPEYPPFEQVVGEEFQTVEGFYTLYQTKNGLFAEINNVGQEFLLATSISSGYYRGYQWSDFLLRWDRDENLLILREPAYQYTAGDDEALRQSVSETYKDTILTTVPVVCNGPNGGPVIDMKALLIGNAGTFVGYGFGWGDSRLSKVVKAKSFPGNTEIAVDLVQVGSNSSTIHYSFSGLADTGFQPRAADDRIGYFLTAYKDLSKDERDGSNFVRLINRWRLEKEDPDAEMSPTKNPIIFYIEKTVPVKFRRYVREGILEWNKAFEKIGLLDAVVVRQQTDTNEFKDYDPEDVRYNFFRWITSETPFAMGPSRVNPRTGEILDADIIFDQAMVLYNLKEHDFLVAENGYQRMHPRLREYINENPKRDPLRLVRSRLPEQANARIDAILKGAPEADRSAHRTHDHFVCEYGVGRMQQMAMAGLYFGVQAAAEGGDAGEGEAAGEWPEEFIGAAIKDTVMHEVGHTLGLRHNFKASSWRSVKDLNNGEKVESVTCSVMDYPAFNIQPPSKQQEQGAFMNSTIGPWDYWVIEYGYNFDGSDEHQKAIAARSAEPQLAYGTDEDTWSADPTIARWDMGSDTLEFATQRMKLIEELLANLEERVVPEGESYTRLRMAFNWLMYEYEFSSSLVNRWVGGQTLGRAHRGDANAGAPIQIVDAARQREALRFACEHVLSDKAFQFDPDLLNKLAAARWYHWGSSDMYAETEYPIHDKILSIQLWTLFEFLNG